MSSEQSAGWNIFHAITKLLDDNNCKKDQTIILNENGYEIVEKIAVAFDVMYEEGKYMFSADGYNFSIIVEK